MRSEKLEIIDQKKIYTCKYIGEKTPNATIVLIHGLGEHCRRYETQAEYFASLGVYVYTADLPGHGRTEGKRGWLPSMENNYTIIDFLIKKAKQDHPDRPVILYGHSMGGNIVLKYYTEKKPFISGLIATGAAIETAKDLPMFLVNLVQNAPLWLRKLSIPNGLDLKYISTDPVETEKYQNDPLVHDQISLGSGADMLKNGYYLKSTEFQAIAPVLLMHGALDKITLVSGTDKVSKKWKGDIELKYWPDMVHEIHNEPDKKIVWDYILDWIHRKN